MRRKLVVSLLVLCMCSSFIGGCGKKEKEVDPLKKSNQSDTKVAVNHDGKVQSPLTGQWIKKEEAKKRPIALMIENTHACLPQYGISKADVIYECPVEGGITRLMCIFQDYSDMAMIGNIRSCRDYYLPFAQEFNAIYFHCGQSKYALDMLNSGQIDHVDANQGSTSKYFYKAPGKKAPHHVFTSTKKIDKAIDKLDFETTLDDSYKSHFKFPSSDKAVSLPGAKNAAVVSLYYRNPKAVFIYKKATGMYYRQEFGEAQVDALGNKTLSVKNIIIQNCKSEVRDPSNGTLSIEYNGTGTGKYITNGKAIDITWKRDEETNKTTYYNSTGKKLSINQGKTWVCVCENSKTNENKIYATEEEYKTKK
ncbi:Protein of unknown function [Lachnospiraceae bacterium C7]|nr:Protein of unknown function [Lachnospiraceae bacterium C7]